MLLLLKDHGGIAQSLTYQEREVLFMRMHASVNIPSLPTLRTCGETTGASKHNFVGGEVISVPGYPLTQKMS
jgi:hypothetical protein